MTPYPRSDHFNGRRFLNVDPTARIRPLSEVWRWHQERQPSVWPKWIPNGASHPIPEPVPGRITVIWIGHSTFLIRIGKLTILTDPVFAMRAGPFALLGPRRVRAPGLALEQLPRIDLILQSHNHYDHLDLSAHRAIARWDRPVIVTPLGNRDYLPRAARPRTIELDWWEATEPLPGVRVTVVPAQHFSARTPWDRDVSLWGGLVVEAEGRRLYFAGDSGFGAHFKEIGRRFPDLDVALLPIGAYEPRWFMGPVHVDPTQAVQAHLDLAPKGSVAMHFGTFQLTDEGIDDPVAELAAARRAAGLADDAFRVPEQGATITY